jgi:hypothetical protein
MNNYAINELARKDFVISITIWIALELLCFWFLPAIKFIEPGDRLRGWFFTSLPLGIGGALLSAASSRFMAIANELNNSDRRSSRVLMGQIMGGLGLAGVFFPFFMAVIAFFTKLQVQYG